MVCGFTRLSAEKLHRFSLAKHFAVAFVRNGTRLLRGRGNPAVTRVRSSWLDMTT